MVESDTSDDASDLYASNTKMQVQILFYPAVPGLNPPTLSSYVVLHKQRCSKSGIVSVYGIYDVKVLPVNGSFSSKSEYQQQQAEQREELEVEMAKEVAHNLNSRPLRVAECMAI